MDDETKYVLVWLILLIFTILEIWVLGFAVGYEIIILSILLLAEAKAILVAGFYQHLFYEKKYLRTFYLASVILIVAIVLTWTLGR